MDPGVLKRLVKDNWERESCGARYGEGLSDRRAFFDEIERTRYEQDYMLKDFAEFPSAGGKRVLEVGLGTGSDFIQWCRSGAEVHGRDLTTAAVRYVRERVRLENLSADAETGDAENLDFPENYFDLYYSWGVLMYPDIEKALAEAHRVLKPGGTLKIMLYSADSIAVLLIWLLYGLLRFDFRGARHCFYHNVEGIGTKLFSTREIRTLLAKFFRPETIEIKTFLSSGDLLTMKPSYKYQGGFWKVVLSLYPRWFVKRFLGHRWGMYMTIKALK